MSPGTALSARRARASSVVRAAYAAADRRNAEALILGWLLGACDGADAGATADYVAGVRQGLTEAQGAAEARQARLRALGPGGLWPVRS